MESLRSLTAILLCTSLCGPAPMRAAQQAADAHPPHATAKSRQNTEANSEANSKSGQLRGDERILQALNRFTFGPKPGDLEAVRKMGLDKWFDEQLHPANIDQTDLNARLGEFPAMQWSLQDLFYRLPSNAIIRQAAEGRVQIPQGGTLQAVYENQIYRLQARKTAKAEEGTVAANSAPSAVSGAEHANTNSNARDGMEPNAQAMSQDQTGQAAPMQTPQMNAMTPGAANTTSDRALAPADEALIERVIALSPEQRVLRLQQMQPAEFESFMKSLRPMQRQALMAGMSPDLKECVRALESPERTVGEELFAERLTRDIYSPAQLQEVMTDFWLNHFNIYVRKNEQMPYYLVSYERDVIRPHALGKFEDLLEAVAHSPAMMLYLDNAESVGPDSPAARRAKMAAERRPGATKKRDAGLNENYARELMELHTLGVNGGYTQADVIQVARVLTGWTVDRPQFGGGFIYAPLRHEPGTKTVLGTKIKERTGENGEMEGEELLHMLAMRPATAQFISRKLAMRFVSDDPPQALVDRMAKTYLASGGDIPSVLETLFHAPEFWAASDYRAKVKTPLEFVVSAARASNANVENFLPLINALRQMGMPLYGCMPPTGYKWDAGDWVSTGALVDRMNFALSLAANRLPGISVEWAPQLDGSNAPSQQANATPESEEARLERLLVAGGVSIATRSAALEQFKAQSAQNRTVAMPVEARRWKRAAAADQYEREDQLLAGLLLGSPEFQRR